MSDEIWVGLDVGLTTTAACIVDAVGSPIREESLPTSAAGIDTLLDAVGRERVRAIGLEAGSTSIYLARRLVRLGYDVAVFECRQVATYLGLRQNKTDRNDARCIAEVARTGRGFVSEVRLKTMEAQRIRSMLTMRDQFVRMRVAGEASVGSLLQLYGGKMKSSNSAIGLRRQVGAELTRLRDEEGIDLGADVEAMVEMCERMRVHVQGLDRAITAMAKEHPVCRRFLQIPGVGALTALSFYSAVDDPFRFKRSDDVGAYLGLVPRVRQSGGSRSYSRISKMGNTLTRYHLVAAAGVHLRATSADTALKLWGTKVRERRGWGKARAAVARKLAVLMLTMWKQGSDFDPDFPSAAAGSAEPPALLAS